MKDNIYFWFDSPPKVGKGAFNYVANHWPCRVSFIFNNDFRAERKVAGWNDGEFGKANVISLFNESDPENVVRDIFNNDSSAIHIVNGLTTHVMRRVSPYLPQLKKKIFVLSERPVQMGRVIEKMIRISFFYFKYSLLYYSYDKYMAAFLPLGKMGVDTFSRYGWNKEKMYPFMYNPMLPILEPNSNIKVKENLRFLYIGRFYYKTKGVDVLMKATRFLKGNWSLDMVGGYGKNSEEVIEWASKAPNVQFKGTWDSNTIIQKMRNYDVVCVPTRYDGWNLLINESIYAGIGIITSDEAVSHELIAKSHSGKIVKAGDARAFSQAMQYAIDNHDVVEQWKQNAFESVHLISCETVGRYLYDIINYETYHEGCKPVCPWS